MPSAAAVRARSSLPTPFFSREASNEGHAHAMTCDMRTVYAMNCSWPSWQIAACNNLKFAAAPVCVCVCVCVCLWQLFCLLCVLLARCANIHMRIRNGPFCVQLLYLRYNRFSAATCSQDAFFPSNLFKRRVFEGERRCLNKTQAKRAAFERSWE